MHPGRPTTLIVLITSFIALTLFAAALLPAQAQTDDGSGPVFLPLVLRPAASATPDSNPVALELMGQLAEPVQTVAVLDKYVYLGTGARLAVVEISDPAAPVVIGRSETLSGPIADIAAAPRYVYVAAEELHVMNVFDPSLPFPEGVNDTPGPLSAVAVAGNYAYAAATESNPILETLPPIHTVRAFDVTDAEDIDEQGIYELPQPASALDVSGKYLYVADGENGLRMIDITVAANPVEVGSILVTGIALDVAVSGRYAYIAASTGGIRAINITDPPALDEDAFLLTSDSATHIVTSGDRAYVALANGGVLALRIVQPPDQEVPVLVEEHFYMTPGIVTDLAVDASYLYLADSSAGLLILQRN